MRVRQVLVRRHKFFVHIDVEHTVYAGYQVELGDVFAGAGKGFARHPGGAQGMASMLTILQAYLESILCHIPHLPRQDSIILRSETASGQWRGGYEKLTLRSFELLQFVKGVSDSLEIYPGSQRKVIQRTPRDQTVRTSFPKKLRLSITSCARAASSSGKVWWTMPRMSPRPAISTIWRISSLRPMNTPNTVW